jgi:hypothetical protein
MAQHQPGAGHGHGSTDDQYVATPPGAGYEHTDANVGIIVRFLFWLAVMAVVVHVGMWSVFALFVETRREVAEPQFPLAVGAGERLPPSPRLQRFPIAEYREFRAQEDEVLQNYGWIDRAGGTVHIPISEAMRLTIERGLPVRDVPVETTEETLGLMPSDASAGRTFVQRRQ